MRQAVTIFAAGLALRLAYLGLAQPIDAPATADYAGDAAYWQQIAAGQASLEAVLPFRPPGMSWFVQALWDGTGSALAPKLVLAVLGALVGPLLYLALRRGLPESAARIAGWICALHHGLVVLGGGLHSEVPYLLLALLTLPDFERLRTQQNAIAAARWSILHGLAALFRADHVLQWCLCMAWLAWRKKTARARDLGIAAAAFAVTLLPWQVHANSVVDRFNAGLVGSPAPRLPMPGFLPWDDAALAAVRRMPAFAQAPSAAFVNDTVRTRGGSRVTATDLDILLEAYGSTPEPLHKGLIAIYGPLNFFLANAPEGDGGFTRAPLDRFPEFRGGLHRYPPGIERALPKELELGYPPHLWAMNHGYREGLRWLAANPAEAAARAARKLRAAWSGTAAGLGLCNAPLGRSGARAPVDLAVAQGVASQAWQAVLWCLLAAGLWRCRGARFLAPLAIWGLSSAAVSVAFFGYARLGALCAPAAATFWAVPLAAWLAPALRARPGASRLALCLATALAAADLATAALWRQPLVHAVQGPHGHAAIEYGRPH